MITHEYMKTFDAIYKERIELVTTPPDRED
jgi:hypothetical protein